VIVDGNGPQVGLLASQGMKAPQAESFPLDVLDAETQGMIGYTMERELGDLLPGGRSCATLLTMVEVVPTTPISRTRTSPSARCSHRLRRPSPHMTKAGR
jgi:carbamate kinase